MKYLIFLFMLFVTFSCSSPVITEDDYSQSPLKFSEIMYDGLDSLDFIEIKNVSDLEIPMDGISVTGGISYCFKKDGPVLEPGDFVVLTNNKAKFLSHYKNVSIYDEYHGQLSNNGESIMLLSPFGEEVTKVDYDIKAPWPTGALNSGYSIEYSRYLDNGNQNIGEKWVLSSKKGGTPGCDDEFIKSDIVINEYKPSHDDEKGFIELYNKGEEKITLSGWKVIIGDKEYIFDEDSMLKSKSYYVIDGLDFELLDRQLELTLYDDKENLINNVFVEPVRIGKSFGRVNNGDQYFELEDVSKGEENGGAYVGDLVISYISYHPVENDYEFLVLKNIGDDSIVLGKKYYNVDMNWKIDKLEFQFPLWAVIHAGESVILVKGDNGDAFKKRYELSDNVQIFEYDGSLSNNNDFLLIQKPIELYLDNDSLKVSYETVDCVHYFDYWYPTTDGKGDVLKRKNFYDYGNNEGNWTNIGLDSLKNIFSEE